MSAWFLARFLIADMARELPCDYHTAHRVIWVIREQQIRLEEGRILQGTVEVDEIYQTAGHKGRPPRGKEEARRLGRPPRRRGKKKGRVQGSAARDAPALSGMVSRDGQMVEVEVVVPDVQRSSLEPVFRRRVAPGSTIYTDAASCYAFLEELG